VPGNQWDSSAKIYENRAPDFEKNAQLQAPDHLSSGAQFSFHAISARLSSTE
jgi:hypothetical protein